MKWLILPVFLVSMVIMVGCGAEGANVEPTNLTPAAQTLQSYLQALVDKNEDALVQMTCADWEANALLEFDAFGGVETSLDGLSCQQVDGGSGTATVVCQGKILASYQDEVQEFDLSGRSYQMVEQGGDWLVCGY
jgi:hypothetical protein